MRHSGPPTRPAPSTGGGRQMIDERLAWAAQGRTRRQLLRDAGGLGIALAGAAPAGHALARSANAQPAAETLVLATNRAPSDFDPQAAYDAGSLMVLRGPFETLIQVVAGTTDRYEPALARAWEANADKSVWTFHLQEGVTFHDGTPCD